MSAVSAPAAVIRPVPLVSVPICTPASEVITVPLATVVVASAAPPAPAVTASEPRSIVVVSIRRPVSVASAGVTSLPIEIAGALTWTLPPARASVSEAVPPAVTPSVVPVTSVSTDTSVAPLSVVAPPIVA